MKKQSLHIFVLITAVFGAFVLGLYVGRGERSDITVSVPPSLQTQPTQETIFTEPVQSEPAIVYPIDINSADKEALMTLPGIGEVLAQRILDYRQAQGGFSYPEDLLNIEDIGEKRLENILDLITVGG